MSESDTRTVEQFAAFLKHFDAEFQNFVLTDADASDLSSWIGFYSFLITKTLEALTNTSEAELLVWNTIALRWQEFLDIDTDTEHRWVITRQKIRTLLVNEPIVHEAFGMLNQELKVNLGPSMYHESQFEAGEAITLNSVDPYPTDSMPPILETEFEPEDTQVTGDEPVTEPVDLVVLQPSSLLEGYKPYRITWEMILEWENTFEGALIEGDYLDGLQGLFPLPEEALNSAQQMPIWQVYTQAAIERGLSKVATNYRESMFTVMALLLQRQDTQPLKDLIAITALVDRVNGSALFDRGFKGRLALYQMLHDVFNQPVETVEDLEPVIKQISRVKHALIEILTLFKDHKSRE